jgi:hypothetical protein
LKVWRGHGATAALAAGAWGLMKAQQPAVQRTTRFAR